MQFKSTLIIAASVCVALSPVQADYFKQWYNGDCTGTVNDYQTTTESLNQAGASVFVSYPGCSFTPFASKGCIGTAGHTSDATAECVE